MLSCIDCYICCYTILTKASATGIRKILKNFFHNVPLNPIFTVVTKQAWIRETVLSKCLRHFPEYFHLVTRTYVFRINSFSSPQASITPSQLNILAMSSRLDKTPYYGTNLDFEGRLARIFLSDNELLVVRSYLFTPSLSVFISLGKRKEFTHKSSFCTLWRTLIAECIYQYINMGGKDSFYTGKEKRWRYYRSKCGTAAVILWI